MTRISKVNKNKEVTAMFAGSFNPFTVGHADIASRALAIFDKLIIAVGVNVSKGVDDNVAANLEEIRRLYSSDERVEVVEYSGLTVDYARSRGVDVLVRGVRSVADFEYEQNMADINRRLTGIETVLLIAKPEYAAVSSSIVRELRSYGADVTSFLPSNE